MKWFSKDTLKQHQKDLRSLHGKGVIEQPLERFIVNKDGDSWNYPMLAIAYGVAKEWAAVGMLDVLDLLQVCYYYLKVAYDRVDWDKINNSDNPKVRLWKFIKKSVTLDMRHYINAKKDGMKISTRDLWKNGKQDDFFTVLYPQLWFWHNDESLNIFDTPTTKWDQEMLYEGLMSVMSKKLSDTERIILMFSFGIDEYLDKPKSQQFIADYFNQSVSWVQTKKFRALKKLRNEDVKKYLQNFYDFQ